MTEIPLPLVSHRRLFSPLAHRQSGRAFEGRVLTKDSPENRGFFGEGVKVVVEVVVDPQRQIDHFDDLGDDLRAAAEPR